MRLPEFKEIFKAYFDVEKIQQNNFLRNINWFITAVLFTSIFQKKKSNLTLIWVGFWRKVGGERGWGIKLPSVSKVLELRWKLEIWYVRAHVYVVSENMPF